MGSGAVVKGQNVLIERSATSIRVRVSWTRQDQPADLDLVALLLGANRRVRSDADMVFYNQSSTADGSVVHAGKILHDGAGWDELIIDLDAIDDDVHCVAVAASIDPVAFGNLGSLSLELYDGPDQQLVGYPVTGLVAEKAVVLGEVYRRYGDWRFRAVGQGWDSGLAGLASDFGINVDEDPPDPAAHDTVGEHLDSDDANDTIGQDISAVDTAAAGEPTTEMSGRPSTETESTSTPDEPSAADPVPPLEQASPTQLRTELRVRRSIKRAKAPEFTTALDDHWQPARLFSVAGIGGADEQEKRATSALLWTIAAVRPLARALTARAGAPVGMAETFLETQFPLGDRIVIPDGVIRIARGPRIWTALVEVKTSDGVLRKEQLESYAAVARKRKFDALVTISNEISADPDVHPVELSAKATSGLAVAHLSWSEIMHEVRTLLAHHAFTDPMQVWILTELLRYLEHPRSGAVAFHDMGSAWVPTREAVAAGTLRTGDRNVAAVVDSWHKLSRQIALGLSARLGVPVKQTLSRKVLDDPAVRVREAVQHLADHGLLTSTFKVAGAAGPVTVLADIRTSKITVSSQVAAPQEGTLQRRVSWLVRQLKAADDRALVEALFAGRPETTCEQLTDVREHPSLLIPGKKWDPSAFRIASTVPMGTKRSGPKGSFVSSVNGAVDSFYVSVVEHIRPWTPPAPQLLENVGDVADLDEIVPLGP